MTSKSSKQDLTSINTLLGLKPEKNDTALAQYIWTKNLAPNPDIEWCILKKCKVIKPGDKLCDLCVSKKVYICKAQNDPNNINKRNDVGTRCCHEKNIKLGAVT